MGDRTIRICDFLNIKLHNQIMISFILFGTNFLAIIGVGNLSENQTNTSLLQHTTTPGTATKWEAHLDSNSSSQLENTFGERVRRKWTVERGNVELTKEICSDIGTFYSTPGKFQAYTLEVFNSPEVLWDENETVTFQCKLDTRLPSDCKELFRLTVKNTLLVINGVVYKGDLSSRYPDPHNETQPPTKSFDIVLHYESHVHANLSCVTHLTNNTNLVSNYYQIPKVDELFEVNLTPTLTEIKVGLSYNLTCSLGSKRAFRYLRWTRKTDFESDEEEIKCGPEVTCIKSEVPPRWVIIMTTRETEDFEEVHYIYYCGTRYTGHAHQPQAEARVTVQVRRNNVCFYSTFVNKAL